MDNSSISVKGKPPSTPPPRVAEFDALEQKAIETLVDAVKYFTTTAGIALSVYSQLLQRFVASGLCGDAIARLIVLLPLILWLATIVSGVFAIYPKAYKANTDLEKEKVVVTIRNQKRLWATIAVSFFLAAFFLAVYSVMAQLWGIYPFTCIP